VLSIKGPENGPFAKRMFGTKKSCDGWLVIMFWWHGDLQQSAPVSGPYETEQEADSKALELSERKRGQQ
jgi:hypothetical protein